MAKAKISKALRERVIRQEETPRVTFRFFVVTEGPLIDELRAIHDQRRATFKEATALGKTFGANEAMVYRSWLFGFTKEPDAGLWKGEYKHEGKTYYKPNRRGKEGRTIAAAIKKLPTLRAFNDAVKVLGLDTWPNVIDGRHWYRPVVWGWFDEPLFIVKVPWRDYAPEILDAYKVMRDAGEYGSGAMDFALWTPHPTMREVKEWEALKIDAEHREGK